MNRRTFLSGILAVAVLATVEHTLDVATQPTEPEADDDPPP
jgi:hypothetical protein